MNDKDIDDIDIRDHSSSFITNIFGSLFVGIFFGALTLFFVIKPLGYEAKDSWFIDYILLISLIYLAIKLTKSEAYINRLNKKNQ